MNLLTGAPAIYKSDELENLLKVPFPSLLGKLLAWTGNKNPLKKRAIKNPHETGGCTTATAEFSFL